MSKIGWHTLVENVLNIQYSIHIMNDEFNDDEQIDKNYEWQIKVNELINGKLFLFRTINSFSSLQWLTQFWAANSTNLWFSINQQKKKIEKKRILSLK